MEAWPGREMKVERQPDLPCQGQEGRRPEFAEWLSGRLNDPATNDSCINFSSANHSMMGHSRTDQPGGMMTGHSGFGAHGQRTGHSSAEPFRLSHFLTQKGPTTPGISVKSEKQDHVSTSACTVSGDARHSEQNSVHHVMFGHSSSYSTSFHFKNHDKSKERLPEEYHNHGGNQPPYNDPQKWHTNINSQWSVNSNMYSGPLPHRTNPALPFMRNSGIMGHGSEMVIPQMFMQQNIGFMPPVVQHYFPMVNSYMNGLQQQMQMRMQHPNMAFYNQATGYANGNHSLPTHGTNVGQMTGQLHNSETTTKSTAETYGSLPISENVDTLQTNTREFQPKHEKWQEIESKPVLKHASLTSVAEMHQGAHTMTSITELDGQHSNNSNEENHGNISTGSHTGMSCQVHPSEINTSNNTCFTSHDVTLTDDATCAIIKEEVCSDGPDSPLTVMSGSGEVRSHLVTSPANIQTNPYKDNCEPTTEMEKTIPDPSFRVKLGQALPTPCDSSEVEREKGNEHCYDVLAEKKNEEQNNMDCVSNNSADLEREVNSQVNEESSENAKLFKCDTCEKTFGTKNRLQAHQISHSSEYPFACDWCGKKYKRKSHRLRHMKKVHDYVVPTSSKYGSENELEGEHQQDESSILTHIENSSEQNSDLSSEKPFRCETCGKRWKTEDFFEYHKLSCKPEEIPCKLCTEVFSKKSQLITHMSRAHSSNKFECDICGLKASSFQHLKRHQECHRSGAPYACKTCGRRFKVKDDLGTHERRKICSATGFPCANCNRNFRTYGIFYRHWRACELGEKSQPKPREKKEKELFTCAVCGLEFQTKPYYNIHTRTCHKKSHECALCKEEFPLTAELEAHKLTHPAEELHIAERPFACDVCEKRYKEKNALQKHKRVVHSHVRRATCPVCGKSFKEASDMRKHVKYTHEKDNVSTATCEICHEVFPNRMTYLYHRKIHVHTWPYSCGMCFRLCQTEQALEAHVDEHFAKKLYNCSTCDTGFDRKWQLNMHKRKHLAETPYQCKVCEKPFRSPITMQVHLAQKHPNKRQQKCNVCRKKFPSVMALIKHKHVKQHHLRVHCLKCNVWVSSQRELKLHQKQHAVGKENKCEVCHKVFQSSDNLACHSKMHTQEKRYKCGTCTKQFSLLRLLKRHTKQKHGAVSKRPRKCYRCSLCYERFSTVKTLKLHFTTHAEYNPEMGDLSLTPPEGAPGASFQCKTCGKNYKNRQALVTHVETHRDKPYQCTICGKKYRHAYLLKDHINKHTGDQPYQCEECGMKFSASYSYKAHLVTHVTEYSFPCPHCDKSFRSTVHVRAHVKGVHKPRPEQPCPVCAKNVRNLKDHMKVHTQEHAYKCDICENRTFRVKMAWKRHMAHHSEVKPYSCKVCGKGFASSNCVSRHMVVHQVDLPYQCEFCPKRFKREDYRNNHQKTHSEERKHMCSKCGKMFKTAQTLGEHQLVHTDERPFACDLCDKRFKTARNVIVHKRHVHKQDKETSKLKTKRK